MISGNCTNKNCSNKVVKAAKTAAPAKINKTGRTRITVDNPVQKSTKIPRASKCITYHISELPPKEQHN
ncbi:MAG: hypothetical protein K0R50_4106 [Eubacterium sp.]|jgi:hypothetical protein|nr:hypothetical protein [Eubacterium sp.]